MIRDIQLILLPGQPESIIPALAARDAGVAENRIAGFAVRKRSIDARGRQVKYQVTVRVWIDEPYQPEPLSGPVFRNVSNEEEVYIIGAGPAGIFAALQLIGLGRKPVIIERGKDVRSRRRDLASITKNHIVNPESNYCFGEGGAGTYSDGKLYTRSDKRGDIRRVLDWFIHFGAPTDIGVNARPHIGTNKLPEIITQMREFILAAGGEIHFDTRLDDVEISGGAIKNITLNNGTTLPASRVILATGHSSRMIFELLHRKNILVEAKPFALGVRVEHPQDLIDRIQYHCDDRGEFLPPAYYSLVSQVDGRGVYSFCMCPGGIIAPCATAPGEVVTNGWSPSKRNNPFANSGVVMEIRLEDIQAFAGTEDPLMALRFQQYVEQLACQAGGGTQTAPAQRLVDFCNGKTSSSLPDCSYKPGITTAPVHEVLPEFVAQRLRKGLKDFGAKMKGYYTNDAVVVAVESRTSSPVKVPRDPQTLSHVQVKGLYPCGEGAGYAGGIVSAAIDGMRCAAAAISA